MRKLLGVVLIGVLLVPIIAEAGTVNHTNGCKVDKRGVGRKGKIYFCGPGKDVAHGTIYNDIFHMGSGNDRVGARAGADEVYGGKGNDLIYGRDGSDWLAGGLGADRILDGGGDGDVDVVLVRRGRADWVNVEDGDGFDAIMFCLGADATVHREFFDKEWTVAC